MSFQLKVYTSKSFLLKLEEFKLRTVGDFGSGSDSGIDIESFLFFKTIIYQKAAQITTDITEEELISLKETPADRIAGHEKEPLIRYLKAYKNNTIKSDNGMILKLRNRESISHNELPHYLFLGDIAGREICEEVEKHYGISCFSTKRLTVPENIRKVCLHKLKNTRKALYDKLNETSFNNIHINDPYFFNAAFSQEKRNEIIQNLLKRDNSYNADLKSKLTTTLENRSEKELNDWGKKFGDELKSAQRNATFLVAQASQNDGTRHDRYVFTNRHINILGNSFFSNSTTHYTTYPIGIYGEFLSKELENS
jgi:hypothetical protein